MIQGKISIKVMDQSEKITAVLIIFLQTFKYVLIIQPNCLILNQKNHHGLIKCGCIRRDHSQDIITTSVMKRVRMNSFFFL